MKLSHTATTTHYADWARVAHACLRQEEQILQVTWRLENGEVLSQASIRPEAGFSNQGCWQFEGEAAGKYGNQPCRLVAWHGRENRRKESAAPLRRAPEKRLLYVRDIYFLLLTPTFVEAVGLDRAAVGKLTGDAYNGTPVVEGNYLCIHRVGGRLEDEEWKALMGKIKATENFRQFSRASAFLTDGRHDTGDPAGTVRKGQRS